MIKLYAFPFIFLWMVFFGTQSNAQFTLSGEVRPRAELNNGQFVPLPDSVSPSFDVSQRTRLSFAYKAPKVEMRVAFQDIRNWGYSTQLGTNRFTLLYEGWGKINFSSKTGLIIGRQKMSYDNERVLGTVGWRQSGLTHDGLLFQFRDTSSNWSLDLGAVYHFPVDSTTVANYSFVPNHRTFQFFWLNKKWKKLNLSILGMNLAWQNFNNPKQMRFTLMGGFYLNYTTEKWRLEADAYFQGGKNRAGQDLSAYMAGVNVSYMPTDALGLNLGIDLLSGTDATSSNMNRNNDFSPFFGVNHRYYGHIDWFYVGNTTVRQGLFDAYLVLKYTVKNWNFRVAYHGFLSPNTLSTTVGRFQLLGQEIDLAFKYKIHKWVTLSGGYSHVFATENIQYYKPLNGNYTLSNNGWAWLMLTFKGDFLTVALGKK
ncbi:MAG: alginate export family protein [Saprospiraceae bacterium]|nr:alginate export family protein [Saprospiraceae bacterium]